MKVSWKLTKKTNDVKSKTTTSKSKKTAEKTPNNSNQAILELYKQGMDKVQIARELSMGVGEVELVIGLFKER